MNARTAPLTVCQTFPSKFSGDSLGHFVDKLRARTNLYSYNVPNQYIVLEDLNENSLIAVLTESEINHLRSETPGCSHVTHFNNAGASLMPSPVLDAVKNHLDLEASIGGYEAADKASDLLADTYSSLAKLINCHSDEIALAVNATRAWDMAFYSFNFQPGDKILTAKAEYASNYLAFLQIAEKTGVEIIPVPNEENGQLSVSALESRIDKHVKLIAVTHVPMNGGLVNPAEEIGAVARHHGIPFLLDACQSVGQMNINVQQIGCDLLSSTGRKYLRGPRGTGFLYVSNKLIDDLNPPFIDMRAAEWTSSGTYRWATGARRFETWESNIAGIIGLGAASSYALSIGLDNIDVRVTDLATKLRAQLDSIPSITVHDIGARKCGIVTFSSSVLESAEIKAILRNKNINVSVAHPSSTLLDALDRQLPPVVRSSVHYYNTDEEIEQLCSSLHDLVNSATT